MCKSTGFGGGRRGQKKREGNPVALSRSLKDGERGDARQVNNNSVGFGSFTKNPQPKCCQPGFGG